MDPGIIILIVMGSIVPCVCCLSKIFSKNEDNS